MKKIIAIATIAAFVLSATTASAFHWSSSDITVKNSNSAVVVNDVDSKADTGDNYAGGADGGNGGNSGAINNNNGSDVENSSTGNGGNGGAAGADSGGTVVTGNAGSEAGVMNVVNSNDTKVKTDCGCKGDITVRNRNRAFVANDVDSKADTGDNVAKGADGGNGGNSGAINNNSGEDVEDS